MAIDFVAAREQLRLPVDADVFEFPGVTTTIDGRLTNGPDSREFREFRFGHLNIQILPTYLGQALGAFDGGEITGAAATRVGTNREMMILATPQDFDEVAAALKKRGFDEDGDVLVATDTPQPSASFSTVADAGEGAIVLAGSTEAAEELLTDGNPSEAAALLKSVSGVARSAATRIRSNCLLGIAAGQDLEPPKGQLAIRVRGKPNEDSLEILRGGSAVVGKDPLAPVVSGLRFGEPIDTADGFVVDVRYRRLGESGDDVFALGPIALPHLVTPGPRAVTNGTDAIYRCP